MAGSQVEYVCGFMFNSAHKEVVLIQKIKPEYLRGLWNGVGGKVEPGELRVDAMVREFEEETGCATQERYWHQIAKMNGCTEGQQFCVHFFMTDTPGSQPPKTTEQELVRSWKVERLPMALAPHLSWLIPMALDLRGKHANFVFEEKARE